MPRRIARKFGEGGEIADPAVTLPALSVAVLDL